MDLNINSEPELSAYFSNITNPPAIIRTAGVLGLQLDKNFSEIYSQPGASPRIPEKNAQPNTSYLNIAPKASVLIAEKINDDVKSKTGFGLGFMRFNQLSASIEERLAQSNFSENQCGDIFYPINLDSGVYRLATYFASATVCRFSDVKGEKNFSIPDISVSLTSRYNAPDNRKRSIERMAIEAKIKPQVM